MAQILCIEPDRTLARLYREFLTLQGHVVQTAQSAQSAISAADAVLPELVLLELRLPKHSGIAFLQEFAGYDDWQHIPIIVHSFLPPAHMEAYGEALAELGVVERLYKPQTTMQHLSAVVARYVGHQYV